MDRIDVTPVRAEWDILIAQMKADPNKGHFKKNADWDTVDWDGMEPGLKREFIDFLVSSCTAEFSGCVLYKEMKRRGNNPDICELFNYMARDEARMQASINDALPRSGRCGESGLSDQGPQEIHPYFPAQIHLFLRDLLSEKIGYARYIHPIYRHLEAHPEQRFHPIFQMVQGMVQR